jgi:hypothetical protein
MVLGTIIQTTPYTVFHGLQKSAKFSEGEPITLSFGSRHYDSPRIYMLHTDDDPCWLIPKRQLGFSAVWMVQEYLPASLSR